LPQHAFRDCPQAAIREAQRAAASAATPSYQQALGGVSGGMPQLQQQPGMQQGVGLGMGGAGHPATPPLGQVQWLD